MNSSNAIDVVLAYHEATKHHPRRLAQSLGYLDWATQPNPFRRFLGAPTVPLLMPVASDAPSFDALVQPGLIRAQPVCAETLSDLLLYSLAISAWKEFQRSRWALRVNPSSGNLHPTEGYLMIGTVEGLTQTPGVFHYAPEVHALERRCEISPQPWRALSEGLPQGAFLIGLTSIHWREAWKYGERAYRYCQHDVGHALAALAFAAHLCGWTVRSPCSMGDAELAQLLGLDRAQDYFSSEREQPDLIAVVEPTSATTNQERDWRPHTESVGAIASGHWFGKANRLSPQHVPWTIIDDVAAACTRVHPDQFTQPDILPEVRSAVIPSRASVAARQIIRQRRSAVSMDGVSSISADQLFLMLDRTLPRLDRPPWTALGPPVQVHLALFVHRVRDMVPGLYFLLRDSRRLAELINATHSDFDWERPTPCPPSLPLYLLREGDFRQAAGSISCGQSIAADGAFSLAMIAAFEEPLRTHGAWTYRRLFWETGMIGQVLYLEAEAAGIRGTGIGCFFDDLMHELLGLNGIRFQSLYHFTVGRPVVDLRLTTLPPYTTGNAAQSNSDAESY